MEKKLLVTVGLWKDQGRADIEIIYPVGQASARTVNIPFYGLYDSEEPRNRAFEFLEALRAQLNRTLG